MSAPIRFEEKDTTRRGGSSPLALLPDGKIRRAAVGASAAIALGQQVNAQYKVFAAKREWSIVLESDDDLYNDLLVWITERIPHNKHKALRAWTNRQALRLDTPERYVAPETALHLSFNSSAAQHIVIDKHKIRLEVELGEIRHGQGFDTQVKKTESIKFVAKTEAGKDAIIRVLNELANRRSNTQVLPRFYIANKYGGWSSRSDLPLRDLETVTLAEGQKERIVDDIEQFFDVEEHYATIGAPWHRGYLFHGPPGTGKTSLAKALATYFSMDIYYLPLADVAADSTLLNLINDVAPRSLLLLEDIDVLSVMQDREKEDTDTSGVSLSGVLNALDGVTTPHGLITIMTTNRRGVLDGAIIRPGRVDVEEHIGLASPEQLVRMFNTVYPDSKFKFEASPSTYEPLAPAAIMDVFKRHPEDHVGAAMELMKLVRETITYAQK